MEVFHQTGEGFEIGTECRFRPAIEVVLDLPRGKQTDQGNTNDGEGQVAAEEFRAECHWTIP
jgi:hypothetical protein